MVTPTFPRQLLEVEFHFIENFIFQNKANRERSTYFLSSYMGPTELSVLMRKTGLNTQVRCGTGQNLKHSILQIADKILQSAHMLQTGKEMATE